MNQRTVRWAATAAVMLVTGLTVAGQTPADVSGDWAVTGETDAGAFASSFVLEQNGTELTGHYSSELLGEAELKGNVSGNDVTFSFSASAQGYDVDVTYTCTLQDDGTLSGQIDVGGLAGGTITAKRR